MNMYLKELNSMLKVLVVKLTGPIFQVGIILNLRRLIMDQVP